LFVESAWKGNDGGWRNRIVQAEPFRSGPLLELVRWCQDRGIPTVFWNKEDPPNFERFIHAAALFDHVFTTDANCVPLYRGRLGHDRVHALPFGAQPLMHNPIDSREPRYGKLCFAGTYYAKRHTDRRGQIEMLLRPALQRGLTIFDRMHGKNMDDHYGFPPEYHPVIRGGLPYEEMVDAYRRFDVFLNVNSVTDSPTMFSRRVFEILACGTPVLSTYALAIERLLGPDVVPMVTSDEEAAEWMDRLLADREAAERMVHRGQRRIFGEHTYAHRLRTVLEKIGIPVKSRLPGVSVITCTRSPARLENAIANYERQVYAEKELMLVLNSDEFSLPRVRERLASVPNARVLQLRETCSFGQCHHAAVRETHNEYWAQFDDSDSYGPYFLNDMLMPFAYSEASIVGKASYYARREQPSRLVLRNPGKEHRYVTELPSATMLVSREVASAVQFPDRNQDVRAGFLRAALAQGFKAYSADRFNYTAREAEAIGTDGCEAGAREPTGHSQLVTHTDDWASHVLV
jgi:spore maturation protein CgeB